MRKTFLIAVLGLAVVSGAAFADVVAVPVQQTAPDATPVAPMPPVLPAKGMSMANVVKQFGEPAYKHPPAGDGAPTHPPITRWDYEGFSVFFAHGNSIDTVVKDHPPELHHADELKPAQ